MAEYKARRARKRASGGKVGGGKEGPPHGHMIIMIGLTKKPKKKAGGKVDGAAARKHLGKRARGGPPKRADGGAADDNWNGFMGEQARQNALEGDKSPTPWSHEDRDVGNGMMQHESSMRPMKPIREPPPPPDQKVPVRHEKRGGSIRRADGGATTPPPKPISIPMVPDDYDMNTDRMGTSGRHILDYSRGPPQKKTSGGYARGGRAPSDGPRVLDAREDAQETGQDGRDKVSQRSGTEERAVEMADPRKRGGHVTRRRADGGATESDFDKPMPLPDRAMSQGSSNSRRWFGKQSPPPKPIEDEGRAHGGGIHIKPSHKGMLHKEMGVPAGEKIPTAKLEKAKEGASPAERKRITFAENARKWN